MNANKQPVRFAKILAAQPIGIGAELVTIEADLSRGLHAFSIIGLPDKAVEEARDRISSAIRHIGFASPKSTNRRIVLSFSPADLRKEGAHYDLPLALAYLGAANEVRLPKEPTLFCGELGLDGEVHPVRGVISQVLAAHAAGITCVFIPKGNAHEASLARDITIYAIGNLKEVTDHLKGKGSLQPYKSEGRDRAACGAVADFAHIKGQESAKRALEIAAVGGHNVVLYGPPGTGKTLLARALVGILPPLTDQQTLEATAIHSIAGLLQRGEIVNFAPFRSPHHTSSHTALIGGGSPPRAGEITLAHHGVLFMDEFSEFETRTLESLRQPLEDRYVTIARARMTYTFPSNCMLVAAFNPAETLRGKDSDITKAALQQSKRISRPIADRLDIWVEVPQLSHEELTGIPESESSERIRMRVMNARKHTQSRFDSFTNATVPFDVLERSYKNQDALRTAAQAAERLGLSPRAFHRTLRVARSIADLSNLVEVAPEHILEALQYRPNGLLGLD